MGMRRRQSLRSLRVPAQPGRELRGCQRGGGRGASVLKIEPESAAASARAMKRVEARISIDDYDHRLEWTWRL